MLLQAIRYLWALPNTLLGLPFLLLSMIHGRKPRRVDGTWEIENKSTSWILSKWIPIQGGAAAITLGHIIIGRNQECLDRCRNHERVHVKQCENWGPFFLPAYFVSSCFEFIRNGDPYLDNYFERQARAREGSKTENKTIPR